MHKPTLFLTLRIFSATGGIEKVSRVAGKALYELNDQPGESLSVFSMYDEPGDADNRYFPSSLFRGFSQNKSRFVYTAVREGVKCKQVVLSHINLLLAGFLIKLFSPKTKLVLFAHGIEVWGALPSWKLYMLGKCDQVIAVSKFTRETMVSVHGVDENKITVLNNCLDPFLQAPLETEKDAALLKRYNFTRENVVLITLTRLSSREQYKGYDNVLYAVKELKERFPLIKYLIIGKYDQEEKQRVDKIISELDLSDNIVFAGFIPDAELAAHYNIADLYIMPSKKEGFGIVFIEAMFYGKPVIAGNKDGSVDALCNGKFGLLIDPDDKAAICNAIIKVIADKAHFVPDHQAVMDKFGFTVYKEKLKKIMGGGLTPSPSPEERGA